VLEQFLQYLRHVRHLSANTLAAYRRDVQRFLDYLGACGLDPDNPVLGQSLLRGFVASLGRQGLSARSVNRVLSALRGYYRFRQKVGGEGANPFRELRSLKTERYLPSFLFEEEMERLLAGSPTDFWQLRDALILELLYSTGCRVAELVAVDLSDLSLKEGSVRVRGKGGKERLVFVGRQAGRLLAEYLPRRRVVAGRFRGGSRASAESEQVALLINRRGERLTVRGVQFLLRRALQSAGVAKPVSPHTFRHSFATHILNRGADIRIVQELLGHASLSTTQVYTHLDVEGLRRVYDQAHPHARRQAASPPRGSSA
jgi:tyrosine recombinase XerC